MLPFQLLGLDSDNGSEFINWHLKAWCERKQIQLTRGRPYKKDDNAHIEQKNWTHVRKLLGWERYRHAKRSRCHERPVPPRAALMAKSVPTLGEVAQEELGVGSKRFGRVYDGPKTPFERVVLGKRRYGATNHSERTAKISRSVSVSKSHRQETRTDLPLGEPAAESESAGELSNPTRHKVGGEKAVEKTLASRAWKSLRDSHFPQPQQQQAFYGYISNGSTGSARVTFFDGLTGSLMATDAPVSPATLG